MKTILMCVLLVISWSALRVARIGDDAITLYYENNAQVELISPQGVRVLIDIYNPDALSSPATEDDILLTTHGHSDHVSRNFLETFPGQQLYIQAGEISVGDVEVIGIASAHNEGDEFLEEGGSNYIFIVDIGDLRFAHLGDIGQDELTDEQLEELGEVDVAITQFVNSYSAMSVSNTKGFNLMDQVQPKLIIPTHFSLDALEIAAERYSGFQAQEFPVMIDVSMLVEDETRFLAVGIYAKASANLYDFPDWASSTD